MGKKKRTGKSEAAAVCAACNGATSSKSLVLCVCTRVVFCSHACQQHALSDGSHACLGAPSQRVNLARLAREALASQTSGRHLDTPLFREEMQRTVTSPMRMGLPDGPQRPEVSEYVRCAELGNLACAYQAGVYFKNRLLGDAVVAPSYFAQRQRERNLESGLRGISFDSTGSEQLGVLETNELSFKYFSQAAEGGLGLAMQSLADNYEKGCGVRKSMRLCREWYWRACLAQSAGACEILESKSVLVNEMRAVLQMLGDLSSRLSPGQPCTTGGPNLCSLVVAVHNDLAVGGSYTIPPFAAVAPMLQVGSAPRRGSVSMPLIGEGVLKVVGAELNKLERRGHRVTGEYGRRGTTAQATALSLSEATRPLDSQLFVVPPPPQINEDFTTPLGYLARTRWESAADSVELSVTCLHVQHGRASCSKCLQMGLERLSAVATGSVAISLVEILKNQLLIALHM